MKHIGNRAPGRVAYIHDRCRCDECRRLNSKAEKERKYRNISGNTYFVDAEPVRQRWLELRAIGMGNDEIERAAGISHHTSHNLLIGHVRSGKPVTRIKRETAERIMAVSRRSVRAGTFVDAPDFRGMVLDLMALGYSARWIYQQLGMAYEGIDPLISRAHRRASTYAKMRMLHGNTVTPAPETTHRERIGASRARNFAAKARKEKQGNPNVAVDPDALRRVIEEHGYSGLSLQDELGLASGAISAITRRRSCRMSTLCAIAGALGVREDELMEASA